MSRLVRARPKLPEYFPEWAKCCPEFGEAYQRRGEVVLDLDNTDHACLRCMYCKSSHGILHGVMDITSGGYAALECFDLDEGNYSAVSA